jgi:calcium-dependent protein kinase
MASKRPPRRELLASHENVLSLDVANSLARFREKSVVQRTAASIAVESLSGQKLHELTTLFQKLDRNGDGVVSKEEMIQGLQDTLQKAQLKPPSTPSQNFGQDEADICDLEDLLDDSSKVTALVSLMDTGNNGTIAYSDFLAAAAESCFDSCVDLCWEAFSSFDLDKSGAITRQELTALLDSPAINDVIDEAGKQGLATPRTKADMHAAFATLGGVPQSIEGMMSDADADSDGRITFEEFMKVMMEQ